MISSLTASPAANKPKKLLEEVRDLMRLRHYSIHGMGAFARERCRFRLWPNHGALDGLRGTPGGFDCNFFFELGPGGMVAGLLRRARRDADLISVNDAESVRKCAQKIAAQGSPR